MPVGITGRPRRPCSKPISTATATGATASATSAACGLPGSTRPRARTASPTRSSYTACSWPKSNWIARSWPTSPCAMPTPSDVLPTAPVRRWRPADVSTPTTSTADWAPLLPEGAFFRVMTITSPHNEKLKEIRKLHQRRGRDRAGRFVAEGEDLLAAADAAGWTALERYCAAGSGLIGVEVEPRVLASASALGSGTRALAVYAERWAPAPPGPLCVYLYGVSDPGNVGAVLRSAQAFGASSVALGPGSADPYGPKAVRASMG